MRYCAMVAVGILASALYLSAQKPNAPLPGIAPRATPADYQNHVQLGKYTFAAEFTGHSVSLPDVTLNNEDYVMVEAAVFGPPDSKITLTASDFSLRVNGKKPATAAPYGLVVGNLKNPELEPTSAEQKSKTSVGTGGGQGDSSPPPPYRVPDALKHEYSQRLQKVSLPEGDRTPPQAGLLYFQYHGRADKIRSLELIYAGPAGKFTLPIQP